MRKIVLFGAGKSASSLIGFLSAYCHKNNLLLEVCDFNLIATQKKLQGLKAVEAAEVDVTDEAQRRAHIEKAAIVISLLPPALHYLVAKDCLLYSKNLLTASYVDDEVAALADEVKAKGLLFISEMGLDPGIDHMSAMKLLSDLKNRNAEIVSFYSHCGGLVSPESDDNPWHYKITWNPANVVSAGRSGARYILGGKETHISYTEVFNHPDQQIELQETGPLSWYANRNSLPYIETYGLHQVENFIRTTLRYPDFIKGWNLFVQMQLTIDDDQAEISSFKTVKEWFNYKKEKFLKVDSSGISSLLQDDTIISQLAFLGVKKDDPITLPNPSSATILQWLLEKNLLMSPNDKDMIIMKHEVEYRVDANCAKCSSTLIVKGTDSEHTAMSKTVGLPLAIATTLILENKIPLTGLHIPVLPEIYEPVLTLLADNGIRFTENHE